MGRGNSTRARALLRTIADPTKLHRQHQAYWSFLHGMLAAEDGDLRTAEAHLFTAVEGALRTQNDRCLALAGLAEVKARLGEVDAATGLLDRARQTPHKPQAEGILDRLASLLATASGFEATDPAAQEV
jgi:ATP/maltotriose-dependent transcriptional regulator MalT